MEISGAHSQILTQATKAYHDFKNWQVPFAAVKLNVCLQNATKNEIDELIEDNFRSEKDLLFKKDKNYFILMQGTSIEAAERAVNRLKAKIGDITKNGELLKDNPHNHAAAYILGSIRGTNRMHIKYLDLNPNLNSFDRKTRKIPSGYAEYLRWLQVPKTENLKIKQMINVVV